MSFLYKCIECHLIIRPSTVRKKGVHNLYFICIEFMRSNMQI